MTTRLLILLACLSSIFCLRLPILSNKSRCMAVFTHGAEYTVKMHMKFPSSIVSGYKWRVEVRNTETNETEFEYVDKGHFRRYFNADESIIYDICFHLESYKHHLYHVAYEAMTSFFVDAGKIKIPYGLPKTKDIRNTYKAAERIHQAAKKFYSFQVERQQNEESRFNQIVEIGGRLVMLCRIYIIVLVAVGLFQVIALRGWFKRQQLA